MQRLRRFLLSPRLLYAQVREDPEIDLEVLAIQSTDRLLAVTSGGCTALTLIGHGPGEIVSVDCNPAQNALFELKWAAIGSLSLRECRQFLGARASSRRWALYRSFSSRLTPAGRHYWDRRRRLIEGGVLYAGRTEKMVGWLRTLLFGYVHSPQRIRPLFRQKDLSAQRAFYDQVWNNRRWRRMLHWVFHPMTFRLVYPAGFRQRFQEGDLRREWIRKIERAFTEIPITSNYFLSQMLWGRYLPGEEGLPPYLRETLFEQVRRFSGRATWVTRDLQQYLANCPNGSFTKMTLSNALEWFPQRRIRPAFESIAHALTPGGRALVRHLLGVTPLPEGIPLRENRPLSDELTRRERAFLYSRVSVYERV